ncbi:hypothetical protein V2E39_20800 [Chryseobacterium arthrosphaerae]|uniref:Uncharacterized protein n=1 Tax=Chryseobacterium arthrosphaerae TaxID=651561 RepID=A0ABU7R4W9_9FLAO
MTIENQYTELREFLKGLGFQESHSRPLVFFNKNIMIYYRDNQNQWRIKDIQSMHGMDLNSFDLPLDDGGKRRIWKTVSDNYKG